MIKIRGGTIQGNTNLCERCRSYHFTRMTDNQENRYCSRLDQDLSGMVAECNQFDDKSAPSIYDMQQIAWVVESNNKKAIGFLSPSEFKKKHGNHSVPDVPGFD